MGGTLSRQPWNFADSHVELKMGHPDTPTIEEYLRKAPEGERAI